MLVSGGLYCPVLRDKKAIITTLLAMKVRIFAIWRALRNEMNRFLSFDVIWLILG